MTSTCTSCGARLDDKASFCTSCGRRTDLVTPHLALPAGTRLMGDVLVVEKVLGQGGFGITYAALDEPLGRRVAVKEFFPLGSGRDGAQVVAGGVWNAAELAEACERFLEEGRALARFRHAGIVPVHAAFRANHTAYIVMELVTGCSLDARMQAAKGRPLDETDVVVLAHSLGEALAEVHAAGLLHCDVKPSNVIVRPSGEAVLIDFGSAREFAARVSRSQSIVLTPGYAPLEQYSTRRPRTPATDVYSLAATLYHLLTGSLPVEATDRAQGEPMLPARILNPLVSAETERALLRGLEMEMTLRPQSMREFLDLLPPADSQALPSAPGDAVASLAGQGSTAPPARGLPATERASAGPEATAPPAQGLPPTEQARARRTPPRLMTVAVLLVLLGLATAEAGHFLVPRPPDPVAALDLFVAPPAARITIDGSAAGTGSRAFRDLSSGSHRLRVELDGYAPDALDVFLRPGETQRRKVRLSPLPGEIVMDVEPQGVDVKVDGNLLASAVKRGDRLSVPPGRHEITVEKRHHRPCTLTVTVAWGTPATVHARLETRVGALRVDVLPAGSLVLLDGRLVGKTPLILPGLAPRAYRLTVQRDAHRSLEHQVSVERAKTARVEGLLKSWEEVRAEERLREEALFGAIRFPIYGGERESLDSVLARTFPGGTYRVSREGLSGNYFSAVIRMPRGTTRTVKGCHAAYPGQDDLPEATRRRHVMLETYE